MSTEEKTINLNDPLVVGGGNSFYLHDVPGNGVDIEIKRNGTIIHLAEDVQEGWEYWGVPLPGKDRVFDSVKISCDTANAVKVETSLQRTRLNRAAGSVDITNVIPGVKNQNSLDKAHFIGSEYRSNGAADGYEYVQLWNPAGSGKLLIAHSIKGQTNQANAELELRTHIAQLAAQGTLLNKYIGSPLGVGQVRRENEVNVVGATYGSKVSSFRTSGVANENNVFDFAEVSPIIIPEGYGVMLVTFFPAASILAYFEWEEIPA